MTSVTLRSENVRHVKSQHVRMMRFPSSRSALRSEPRNAEEEDWFRGLSGGRHCLNLSRDQSFTLHANCVCVSDCVVSLVLKSAR